jgi:hypothetical protein
MFKMRQICRRTDPTSWEDLAKIEAKLAETSWMTCGMTSADDGLTPLAPRFFFLWKKDTIGYLIQLHLPHTQLDNDDHEEDTTTGTVSTAALGRVIRMFACIFHHRLFI